MGLRKITNASDQGWNKLKNMLNVKFNKKSGWYKFRGVRNGMFVLLDRKGEEFLSNQIFVTC